MRHVDSSAGHAIVDRICERTYFTYIMPSRNRTLYTEISGDHVPRAFEHTQKKHDSFSAHYNCTRLIWFERFGQVSKAIQREKELKVWTRAADPQDGTGWAKQTMWTTGKSTERSICIEQRKCLRVLSRPSY